jgi:hypothetical protein
LNFNVWEMENLEKKSEKWQARLPAAHDGTWPRVPASACPRPSGDTAVLGHHPPPPVGTVDRPPPPSTCNPCSRRLHMRATPLSHVAAMPRPIPLLFLGSRGAPTTLYSASPCVPLFQGLSTTVGSHCCRLMHLRVIIDPGSARQTGHHSKLTGRCPPCHSPVTKLCRPLPRATTTLAHAARPPSSSMPS